MPKRLTTVINATKRRHQVVPIKNMFIMHTTQSTNTRALFTIFVSVMVLATLLIPSLSFAKEITSGGGTGGTTTACNPVSSLTAKGDPRVGETGLANISASYSVKPCDKNAVTVNVQVYEYLTGNVVYDSTNAPLSDTFSVFGVKVRTTYIVKVTVLDQATGAVVGVRTVGVAAIPKGV